MMSFFFGKAIIETTTTIDRFLKKFWDWSRQKISSMKSRLPFSKNYSNNTKRSISSLLQIDETPSLGRYLGFLLKVGKLPLREFTFILDKVNTLRGWKASCLSLAARKVLIQSTSSAIPNCYCQFIVLPKIICSKIDQVNLAFLWGSTSTKKKMHLVNWDQVTSSKAKGGLGLRQT
ncbi:hypothetical protein LIER_34677 [Lithospermum erythrorhizon]|uniref:Uncharacterized protein n=1 Tax=Lithospermum erythrorhizon TaxID=34254 RepID=A0AAV3S0Z1_LITER